MRALTYLTITLICGIGAACSAVPKGASHENVTRGIDSLNARLVEAYRAHDPEKYAALYTDTAVFEWPAFSSGRGRTAMAAMARDNWASLRNMNVKLTVASRRITGDHATEFGAFEQSWDGDSGSRNTEFGRYAVALIRQQNGEWLIDRFFGFEDSTRSRVRQ
jgi:uncharacterized protein (TIGR02246 family)